MEKLSYTDILGMHGQYVLARWPASGEVASVRLDIMEYPLSPGEVGIFFSEDSREYDPWGPDPTVKDRSDDIKAGRLELYLTE